jgi:hypothetical protein
LAELKNYFYVCLQTGESEWNFIKAFGLDAQEVEITGLEQNASYVFEAFIIETDGSKTPNKIIRSGSFQTQECNANSKTTNIFN